MAQSFFSAFNKAKEKTRNVVTDVSNNISMKLQMNLSASPPGSPKSNSVKCSLSKNKMGSDNISNDTLSSDTLPPKVFSVTPVSCGGSAPTIKFSEPMCTNSVEVSSLNAIENSCDKLVANVVPDMCPSTQDHVILNSQSSKDNVCSFKIEKLMALANINETFSALNDFSKTINYTKLNLSQCDEVKSQLKQFIILMREAHQDLICLSQFENSSNALPIQVEVFIKNYKNLSLFLTNFGWSEANLFSDEVIPPQNIVSDISVDPHSNFPYPNDDLATCLQERVNDQIVDSDQSKNDLTHEIGRFENSDTFLNDIVGENSFDLTPKEKQNLDVSILQTSNVDKEFSESLPLPHSSFLETSKPVVNQNKEIGNSTANLKDSSSPRVENSLLSDTSKCNFQHDACTKAEKIDPYWHCIFCNDISHSSHVCTKFSDNKQFWTVIYDEQRCKNCFRQFHQSHKCYDSSFCFLRNCRRRDKHSPVVCSHRYKSSNFKIPFENYFHSSNVYDANFSYQDRSYSNNVSPKTYVSQGTQTEIYNLNTVMVQTENCGSISIGVQTPAHIPREIESSLSSLDSKILEISSSITFETATSADSVSRSPLEICTVSSSLPPQSTESHPVSSSSKCEVNTVNSNTSNSFDPDELTLSFYRMMMPKLRNLPKGGYQNPYL